MITTGVLKDVAKDLESGRYIISFLIDVQLDLSEVGTLKGYEKLSIKAVRWRNKRSLNANAYFHVLVDKMAAILKISRQRCKNILIARYGQAFLVDESEPAVIKSNILPEKMLELEEPHCFPCRMGMENGKEVIFYRMYRGSHTYDTKEMSQLIDGTVQEAKDLGIETLTPDELDRMVNNWKPKG